jgi:hypothetical protein
MAPVAFACITKVAPAATQSSATSVPPPGLARWRRAREPWVAMGNAVALASVALQASPLPLRDFRLMVACQVSLTIMFDRHRFFY